MSNPMRPMPVPSRVSMMVQQANAQPNAQAIAQPKVVVAKEMNSIICIGCKKEHKTAYQGKPSNFKCPDCNKPSEKKVEIKPEIKPDVRTYVKPEIKHEIKPDVKTYDRLEIKHEIKPVQRFTNICVKCKELCTENKDFADKSKYLCIRCRPVVKKKGITLTSKGFVGTREQLDKYDKILALLNAEDDNVKTAMIVHLKQQV